MVKDLINEKKLHLLENDEVKELLYKYDISIKLKSFYKLKGYTYYSNTTDRYYIIINKNLSDKMIIKTLLHELSHIELGHLECFKEDRQKCEKVIRELGL